MRVSVKKSPKVFSWNQPPIAGTDPDTGMGTELAVTTSAL